MKFRRKVVRWVVRGWNNGQGVQVREKSNCFSDDHDVDRRRLLSRDRAICGGHNNMYWQLRVPQRS